MPFVTHQPVPFALLGLTWPMVFWGFALGSIPIIIHLLHRRKYRETTWAAMRFLMEAARKHSKRIRIEQLILLAVRTLILLFLVGGLHGMYTSATQTERPAGGPRHHLLALDASYSMQWRAAGRTTLFDRAKETALKIVDAASTGDAFNLVLITGESDRTVVRTASRSRRDFRNVIQNTDGKPAERRPQGFSEIPGVLAATEERGRLLETLTEIERAVGKVPELPAKTVYVVSDFQRLTWRPRSQPQRDRIRKALKAIGEKARLVLIDVGHDDAENTAVTDFRTDQPFVVSGRELQLVTTLENFGPHRQPDRKVELWVDNQLRDTQDVTLEPRSAKPIHWTYPNPTAASAQPELTPGEHRLEVRLQDDRLNVDNRRFLALPVKKQLNVLLVNGRPAGRPRDEATFFVKKALQPSTAAREWRGIIEPRVITESELLGTDLSRIDCVFLCDVRGLKRNEAKKLQAFVEGGGGLVVSLGERVDVESYNAVLFRDGDGILPAKLGNIPRERYALENLRQFETEGLDHSILNPFVGNPKSGLESVFVFRHAPTEIPLDGMARVVLRFKQAQTGILGDPAIIESPLGQGRVILVTTSLDDRWSTWPIYNPSFPPLVNELVHFAVAGQWADRQRGVGETIVRRVPEMTAATTANVSVKLPNGAVHPLPIQSPDRWVVRRTGGAFFKAIPNAKQSPAGRIPGGASVRREELRKEFSLVTWRGRGVWVKAADLKRAGAAQLFFDETARSGMYEFRLRPPTDRAVLYAVNVDPAEGDLTKLTEAALRKDVLAGVPFEYRTQWERRERIDQVATTRQNDLSQWLLIAAFCLLIVELLMAWKFSPGMLLLGALIAAEFTRQTLLWSIPFGVLLGVAFSAGIGGYVYRRLSRRRVAVSRFPK
jgi:Aerotolerance regulator N-terminal